MSEPIKDNNNIPDFLTSDGMLGEMIRLYNWASTPLGSLESWSQSLKTTVNLMLNSRNPIWMGWGPENTFLYNDAYIDVLGIEKHGWALGKPAYVVWEEIWDFCGPLSDRVYNESKSSTATDVELFMKRGDFLEETFFTFTYSPVFDESGKVGGLFCANFETTDKILNARRTRTLSELAAKSLIEKTITSACASAAETIKKNSEDIPFAIFYLLDNAGNSIEIVQRTGLDKCTEAIFPQKLNIQDTEASASHPILTGIFKTGRPAITTVAGTDLFPIGLAGQPVKDIIVLPLSLSGNKPIGIVVFGINPTRKPDEDYTTFFEMAAGQISTAIQNATALETERKRLEELAEIDKAKTLFFSNVSHEFRTPLTLMLGPLEELIQNHSLPPDETKIIETTHRNAMRLLKLVNTLLDFSLMESGRMKARFVPVDIAAFTTNLASSFRSVIEKAGMTLEVKTETLLRPVYADKQMWEKIVFNLLSNAFKYTLQGSISIVITQDIDNAILRVIDTGLGIPEEELPNMFTRFHRIQNTTGRSYEGTGIGLSMIKELVAQHGGTISVESTHGAGSTFTVTIPFGKGHLKAEQVAETAFDMEDVVTDQYIREADSMLGTDKESIEVTIDDAPINQELVLIVDDNADMRVHLSSIIEKEYRVITAQNGQDALNKIEQATPTLILSDIMMPVMDGIQLLKQVKNNPDTATIPVILLTARAGEESKIEGYETGADDYLVKPFSAKELVARIRSQIKITKTRDHFRRQLKRLFMQAPMAISILRGDNFVVEMANDSILKLWGKTWQQVADKPLAESLPEAVDQGFDKLLTKVYKTGLEHVDEEALFYNSNNGVQEQMYIKFIYQPLYEENGVISGVIVLAHDVTQQVTARKKVEESEAKFRNLIRQAPIGIVVLKGQDLVIDTANDVYASIVGKTREGLIGNSFINALPELKSTSIVNSLKNVLVTGKSHIHEDLPVELNRYGNKETSYYTSLYQPLTENDKITGVIAIVNNVTDQVLARNLREKNAENLRIILGTMPHIAYSAAADGQIEYYNQTFYDYTGLKPEDVNNLSWRPFLHPDMADDIIATWRHSMETGKAFEYAFPLKRSSDQTFRWHMSRAVALRDNEGKVSQWVGTLTDIHDQKVFAEKLEAMVNDRTEKLNRSNKLLAEQNIQLEQTNKELESFNYIASHDLQEPLRKIRTFINLIKDRGPDENYDSYLSKINSSAERMSQLIHAVLAYSRLSSNGDPYEAADLNIILRNVLTDFELLIEEKNAVIEFDVLPSIQCIPLQMNQLFSNLISNSFKYTTEKPVVKITYKEVRGYDIPSFKGNNIAQRFAQIEFQDNGIGFEDQYSEQIFKLFQRLHGRHEYGGTGIGLSICKKITEQHDGYISAHSNPGEGATFTVQLPFEH